MTVELCNTLNWSNTNRCILPRVEGSTKCLGSNNSFDSNYNFYNWVSIRLTRDSIHTTMLSWPSWAAFLFLSFVVTDSILPRPTSAMINFPSCKTHRCVGELKSITVKQLSDPVEGSFVKLSTINVLMYNIKHKYLFNNTCSILALALKLVALKLCLFNYVYMAFLMLLPLSSSVSTAGEAFQLRLD